MFARVSLSGWACARAIDEIPDDKTNVNATDVPISHPIVPLRSTRLPRSDLPRASFSNSFSRPISVTALVAIPFHDERDRFLLSSGRGARADGVRPHSRPGGDVYLPPRWSDRSPVYARMIVADIVPDRSADDIPGTPASILFTLDSAENILTLRSHPEALEGVTRKLDFQ